MLQLLPTSLTPREMAAELYLSLNTIKTHTRALYRKLGVQSRHAAIEEARRRQLIESHRSVRRRPATRAHARPMGYHQPPATPKPLPTTYRLQILGPVPAGLSDQLDGFTADRTADDAHRSGHRRRRPLRAHRPPRKPRFDPALRPSVHIVDHP